MAFMEKVQTVYNHGAIAFTLQLAKDIGVFDVLRNADGPLTSQQVADAKKLKERYVREILSSLASAQIVQLSTNADGQFTFYLEEEAKSEVDKDMFTCMAFMAAIAQAYLPVRECCYADGPYASPYQSELYKYLDARFLSIGDKEMGMVYDKVPEMQENLEKGIKVLEFGSGSGLMLSTLAQKYPKSTFTASEYRDDLVTELKDKWGHIPNMEFQKLNLMEDNWPSTKYDWIVTSDVLHDLPHPVVALKNMRKIINEDIGVFTAFDRASTKGLESKVGSDLSGVWYAMGTFFCIPESFQAEDSEAHGPNWTVATVVSLMKEAGFDADVTCVSEFEALFIARCIKQ